MKEKRLPDHFFKHNHSKMVAILVRLFGLKEIEIAEDLVQDTLVEAMEKWSIQSIPKNPEGWLMDVAKKKTINFLKRNQNFKTQILPNLSKDNLKQENLDFNDKKGTDSTLQMIFVCCDPSLNSESQIALALKTLCGLSVPEIARALLTTEATINKRLYRAKQKFRDGSIEFNSTIKDYPKERLNHVLSTLLLLFNEGYYSHHSEKIIRIDLCYEAIRLTRELLNTFSHSSKTKGLMALMLFLVARFESRLDNQGALIIIEDQDRTLWDYDIISQGMTYLNDSIKDHEVNSYQLLAGIAAEHCLAKGFATTNWESIYKQYKILESLDSSILIQFNKCIAQFYAGEKKKALHNLLNLKTNHFLQSYVHFHTTLGVFYSELYNKQAALHSFQRALTLTKSSFEKILIEQKIETVL